MNTGLNFRLLFLALAVFFLGVAADARAGEKVMVAAKLIWVTNHGQPPDKSYQRADAKLTKDLQRAYKWKNYFIINSEKAETPKNKKTELKMSDECRLKIRYLGDDKFEVWMWGKDKDTGKGKPLIKGTQKMAKNQKVILMGVTDNESGWMVKICRHDK